ncbi:glycoside hydrolase family 15 protein [Streptomyces xinghaiensis]|uniref:glycoside hydrolase family 15 protein n=1 Tax=Streptomyces xinghaiensis TaxID=1038928 RepID=UPI000584F4E6|nr:glycoside hydrolase family 15 protein [Streptomyces xinghaiensis]
MTETGAPWVLREYALLADGERGALIGPRGDIAWMCAPRWHSDAVFSGLMGGSGCFIVAPEDPWNVWGGSYEDGTLIRVSRWVQSGGAITECREALAMPAEPGRAVLLRRIRAVHGDARVVLRLDVRAGFGSHPMRDVRLRAGEWHARSGPLRLRLCGAPEAAPDRDGVLTTRITVPEGGAHDLVLEIGESGPGPSPDPGRLWAETEDAWSRAVPDCGDTAAPRDARHAYAVLHGLTSASGGMVAAATASLPERARTGRNYDYRYAWIRDQCYAGIAVAEHGKQPSADRSVRFITERILADGPGLCPAYTVDGGPVPGERSLPLPGFPGGGRHVGNQAGRQFQLDVFGEALDLLATAARHGRLDRDGVRAVETAAQAVEENWQRPDSGLWELETAWWTHSRLSAVMGLRAAARELRHPDADRWTKLAGAIERETGRRCRHPSGRWQRTSGDPRPDAALLRPLTRGHWPADDPGPALTRREVERQLTQDGYVYRFRHGDQPLGRAEGAFLLCGFLMSGACLADGRLTEAARWFERSRAACGPAGLFAEEYDVTQRQLRGNLPQAFVHALFLESAVKLAEHGG